MRNGFKLASLYAAIVLGAGFASGQELLQYFVGYGTSGIWGLIIAGVLSSLTGWAVLDICHKKEIKDYKELMAYLAGKRLGFVFEILAALFLFALFVAMLSAGGAMFEQGMDINFTVGVLVLSALIFATLYFGLEGLVWVNEIITPVLVIGGIFIGLYTFFNYSMDTFFQYCGLCLSAFWFFRNFSDSFGSVVPEIPELAFPDSLSVLAYSVKV